MTALTLGELHSLYAGLPGTWARLELRVVGWKGETLQADEPAYNRVRAALATGSGWVRLRSAIWPRGASAFPKFEDAGPPLTGEWTSGEDASVHLRGDPATGGLVLTTYSERPAHGAPPSGDEILALRQTIRVLRHGAPRTAAELGKTQDVLVYHVFWGAPAEDPSAIRRLFARFAGFDKADAVIAKAPSR